jgi:peroxiredoxin
VKVGTARSEALRRERAQMKRQQLVAWVATGVAALVVLAVVAVLVVRNQPPDAPPPAKPSAADLNAPKALRDSAAAVGFKPEPIPGVGEIEDKPASDAIPPSSPDLLKVSSAAPAFTATTPLGETVSLASLKGKAVLLEFFATSCPHCQAEAPHLERMYRALDASRYAIVGVNADGENAASIYAYHRYFGLSFPTVMDHGAEVGSWHSPGPPGPITTSYHISRYPTFYVLRPDGTVQWASDGEQPTAKLQQELQQAAGAG